MLLKLRHLPGTLCRCRGFSRHLRIVQARHAGIEAKNLALKPGCRCAGWGETSRSSAQAVCRSSEQATGNMSSVMACP